MDTFRDLGTSLEAEGIELLKCDPNYIVWFADGEHMTLSTDVSVMKTEVERWEGKDGFENYLSYLREAHTHYEQSVTHVLKKNFPSLLSMARPGFLRYLVALHPFESIYRRASCYFRTDRLRQLFTFGSMYMGMSPFDAPGTFSLLQYTELTEGIWYPRGGFHRVIAALVEVGKRFGVRYRLSTPVARLTVVQEDDHGRPVCTGVELASGERLAADVVVVNADLVYAAQHLLPPSPQARSLAARPGSCSSISFYWSMSRTVPELNVHNIFLAGHYRQSFDAIFKRNKIPDEPSFYVNVPSRVDPSAAPDGTDAVIVLVPVGHLSDENRASDDWKAIVDATRTTIIESIEARTGITGFRAAIRQEQVNTPLEWQAKFNLDKGAILGLSHSFFNVLSFRPRTKCSWVDRCFFVGASTHPGTGVPICLAGSKLTADQILSELGSGHDGQGSIATRETQLRSHLFGRWAVFYASVMVLISLLLRLLTR